VRRVLLILPSATYRAPDFLAAARSLGAEVVLASETEQTMAASMGDRAVVLPLDDPEASVAAILALHARSPVDAVVAVDDGGSLTAAMASTALGFRHNPPAAIATTRDKLAMRRAFASAGVPQPRFAPDHDIDFPRVVKPVGLSASRGVIRVDDPELLDATIDRVARIADGPVLVEEYVPGIEVALEGLLDGGQLRVLAVFDKPDPLVGPYFEETIYVTPSTLPPVTLDELGAVAGAAAGALGLVEGPVHAEFRITPEGRIATLELAARSIGGLCARTLRFGAGIALEEVILRHALGLPLDDLVRERAAAGVMMLPIPRAGTLDAVEGIEAARDVPGIVGVELTLRLGRPVVPLPEGDRYLGFVFARGETPADVEAALRAAADQLDIVIG
jgi:biotin carboxylase